MAPLRAVRVSGSPSTREKVNRMDNSPSNQDAREMESNFMEVLVFGLRSLAFGLWSLVFGLRIEEGVHKTTKT
jgi:hypothetical protein